MTAISPRSIEHWAQKKPDEVAVAEGASSLTWAQLDDAANRAAHALRARGIGPADVVAVRTHPRIEWAVVTGALAKLGCAMVGLNYRLTPGEIRHVIADSKATVVVCDDAEPARLVAALEGLPIRLAISVDADCPGFERYQRLLEGTGEKLYAQADPRLIIYTSGTTGQPKGVELDRSAEMDEASLREFLKNRVIYTPFSDHDVTLINMPFHHAAGPMQFWASMAQGNKVVLQRRFDAEDTLRIIAEHRVSHWTAVPTMFKRIEALPPAVRDAADRSSLREIRTGTAPITHELKDWILRYFGEDRLHEVYGASEIGVVAVLRPEMQRRKPGSCGLPLPYAKIEIRDDQGRELPAGQPGEMWVKSPVTIRGYLNAPPLGTDTLDANGFFRTGDVGYKDADGFLYITDRAKDMIIAGGVNIYPAEIEAVLQRHPAVLDAAVIGVPDDEFGERVFAFCELKPGKSTDAATLLAHCEPLLASYKRPRQIFIMDELPRNAMGKVLKKDLRAPYWKGKERQV
ncbi:Long-chain-fatty-acid--CoA ligase LcfB [Cupriavidus taiwanensis]|uniref:Long-chain-fatty-acid--CoA ligase LcfB n=1 Tax=Cupriavidus taiwanensis TaxID=164546 RepID=A0A375E7Y7_9BURK|nr:AMP-binding protein [Cupriavidus taiwanensis]SOZ64401.1 Long-chain-fatty-acid--CoA ligase LcfB [Cupriavidus taiwanensis]SOZ65108.1 Long-chain-fatty-acid--CoA ligase LcfB [Cupriavidus taiwanensis]SOZ68789.1 Long-chain-fatty-acid--CoA ligase LcfB [Cupriavidus taiwanensis]SPA08213.1 Long-chain-fatty-acid--CoA ligase LcfB [Cupriavidus taiwanensis]